MLGNLPEVRLLFVNEKKQKSFLNSLLLAWYLGEVVGQRQGMDKKFFWLFSFTKRTA
jgi:hypothetical protein